MRGLPKLKVNFEYEKKQKEKAVKIPKAHTMNLGKVRKIVLLFLIGLFIYFSYVLVLANAIAQKNKTLRATVTTLSKKLDKASAGTTSYNPVVGQYLANFLTLYYASSDSNADSRSQQLSKYLASNITLPNNVGNSKMKLDSAKLNGIFTVDSVKTAQYSLVVEADGKQSDMTVNVPYAQENEKLTVIGLPYVANTIDSVGHIGTARFDKTGKTINDSEVTAKVVKFTKQFAQKYVSSSTKDMSMLMSDPVGLNGAVDLVTLDDSSIKVTGTSEKPVVTATMTVQVHGTNIMQVQTIRLDLKKQSSTYFVTKFVQA
ncbi:conjugal transfer protein [Leuconostoc citreum]|uniref:conjugal transfer protein n=1 Tax=Leuconostoc citreum TaxID=33964 RepID=UPI0011BB59A2|nr:conjugal transfer protein [Leuconostoc citreum]QEA46249.1 conjugal transfer protein [Leuconostoc citreum]QEA58271.1 conjugal transfer protein [Leuconostoc mesenteroides]QEA62939.1 conjugal transfer protein [Leuconostoc citreum]QGM25789.1 conjugal transfer protein [Leuconostoc mesenteroides subsp. mesenteroides]